MLCVNSASPFSQGEQCHGAPLSERSRTPVEDGLGAAIRKAIRAATAGGY